MKRSIDYYRTDGKTVYLKSDLHELYLAEDRLTILRRKPSYLKPSSDGKLFGQAVSELEFNNAKPISVYDAYAFLDKTMPGSGLSEFFRKYKSRLPKTIPKRELDELNLSNQNLNDEEIRRIFRNVENAMRLLQVKRLNLSQNKVSDLKLVGKLVTLEHLNLNETEVEDLTPIASLVNLKSLSLENTIVEDISPLAKLVNLEHLYLRNSKIKDFSPLETVPKVKIELVDDIESCLTGKVLQYYISEQLKKR